ncbi:MULTISPECIES: hypothetical protein [unclassified Sporosarcina]|uniref:hypothetical protein n=1 Tax=unclassified Sporosarcina TaxID=2647733 RepID=UPI002040293E|nr:MULTISPECIES: hypothetical protein [unclassified Sporosarcina]GKV64965.1 hypothetical protein NCCP2331_11180 [Sporosarcina sp. NCCP-2331]GLB56600.1 hypothetical protein NCCP2378_23870 [Sporosarcina sp. NCCP-2378]
MTTENSAFENDNSEDFSLNSLQSLRSVLTNREEQTFMSILFSSSATIRANNFGLSRKEVEKLLGVSKEEAYFHSFLSRVNQAVGRYYRLIYDEERDQVVVMLRVPARSARHTLSEEALAVLLFMFYQQEVLKHEYTLLTQLLEAFGHEMKKGSRRIQLAIDTLRKIGALEIHIGSDTEDAYRLTAIGVNMFSDSFLHRMVEFSHSSQLSKEDVMKFFNRYNLYEKEGFL